MAGKNRIPFKLERLRKKAGVFFAQGEPLWGHFFISPVSANHDGEETVLELLMSGQRYVPFETTDGQVALILISNIVKVLMEDNQHHMQNSATEHINVELCFISGETMRGKVCFTMPETHSRLSDFLNQSPGFFYLEAEGRLYLINHRHIVLIRPLTPP